MIRKVLIWINSLLIIFIIIKSSYSQEYIEKKYPSYGIGVHFGYSYYFPNDLNAYMDQSGYSSSDNKEHIHSGIDVGILLIYAPYKNFEIVPEFSYLYSRRSLNSIAMDLTVSYVRLGGTLFYIIHEPDLRDLQKDPRFKAFTRDLEIVFK